MIRIDPPRDLDNALKSKLDGCWNGILSRKEIGFPALAKDSEGWEAIANRLKATLKPQNILVIGIGGSSLGTQVISSAFRHQTPARCFFLESPDPHTWASVKALDPNGTHTIVISKSGNTLETLTWVERLHADNPALFNPSRCTVIASPGEGPLQTWAKRAGLDVLWIPANVGGRFSVLTAVGMLPAALMGLKFEDFRMGAEWALGNVGLATSLSAHTLKSWERGEWITQLWTYSEALRLSGEWWQQLWGESLGKRASRTGGKAPRASTPMACAGPRDQHSLVQQLMEGERDKFVFVARVRDVEEKSENFTASVFQPGRSLSLGKVLGAEARAFEKSLAETGIRYAPISLDAANEKTLGAYFMLWQMSIAQLGEYMGIDAFNQPGVELGKKYAAEFA